MDIIRQYQEILQIQPKYNQLVPPYIKGSQKRIEFNLNEIDLILESKKNTQNTKIMKTTKNKKTKKGGDDKTKKICYIVDF